MSWSLDTAHSKVGFAVKHMMISKVRGEFTNFEAEIDIDPQNLSNSSVEAQIDVSSVDTSNADRDEHLRGEDFFGAEKYPEITFKSTEFQSGDDGSVELTGDLTIRDVTREVTLTGQQQGPAKSPWGDEVIGYNLTGQINRKDFDLTWNQALETGGVLVGKTVEIEIDAEVVRD